MTTQTAVSQLITSLQPKLPQELQGFVFLKQLQSVSVKEGDLFRQHSAGKGLNNMHHATWSDDLQETLLVFSSKGKSYIPESTHAGGIYSKTKHNSKFKVLNVYYFICACF